jgi:hypothetical protein
MSFPIIYQLRIENAAAARRDFENVTAAFQRGEVGAQSVDKALRRLDSANSAVVNSTNKAVNAWRAAHPTLAQFERGIGRLSSIASTLRGIFDSVNILTLRMQGNTREMAEAEKVAAEATRARIKAHQDYVEGSPERIIAEQNEREALERLVEAQRENFNALVQGTLQTGAYIALLAAPITKFAVWIAHTKTFTTVIAALGEAFTLSGVATGALVAGIGVALASLGLGIGAALKFRVELGRWPRSIEEVAKGFEGWPPVLKEIGTIMTTGVAGWGKFFEEILPSALGKAHASLTDWFGNVQRQFGTWMSGVADFITSGWNSLTSTLQGIWNGILSFAGDVWSRITDVIRGAINGVIDLLNRLIAALNSIKIDIPSWVPVLGGQTFGINIPLIPKLAEGGIVTKPTVALLGERGPELVTPLSAGGGAGINVTVNITGFVGTQAELVSLIAREIKSELQRLMT